MTSKWCEHCRGHFAEDHYSALDEGGVHKTGREFGPEGALLESWRLLTEIVHAYRIGRPVSALMTEAELLTETED